MNKKNLQPNKVLGQHFLKDQNIIKKICSDFEGQYDAILEVGPGPGALTNHLVNISKNLFVIEKDPPLKVDLETSFTVKILSFPDLPKVSQNINSSFISSPIINGFNFIFLKFSIRFFGIYFLIFFTFFKKLS